MTFWTYKSPAYEADSWLEASLALAWDESLPALVRSRAKVLNVAGYSAVSLSNFQRARSQFEEGLSLYVRLGDQRGVAFSRRGCAFAAMIVGDYARAQSEIEHSLAICQETQDEWGLAWSVFDLGYLALARGDLVKAGALLEKALHQSRHHGILWAEFRSLIALGNVHRRQGQRTQASAYFREALVFQQKYQFSQFVASIFEGVAQLVQASGDGLSAARLLGVAQKRRDTIEMARWFPHEAEYQRSLALLHEQLTDEAISKAWLEGHSMSSAEAIVCALDYVR